MAANLIPLHDRVLVRRVYEKETTPGGLIIPDTAKEKPQEGMVLAVGRGKVTDEGKILPPDVKEGDRILFSQFAGNEIVFNGEEYLIMHEHEILGILPKSVNKPKAA